MRPFAMIAALAALTFSSQALVAQSTSTSTAKPSMSQTTSVHAKQDTAKTTTSTASSGKTMGTHHAAWTKDQIKEAQEGLAKVGLYKGKATGVFNADTRKALKAYQKQNKMPATGRLSDSVLVKLKSA
jgi:peptidoglycan hydrolase-like protein with peptidoglycan-binding domain